MSAKPSELVSAFYDAVANADAESLTRIVLESFHQDASVSWPEGLFYGGTVSGAAKLAKVFGGMAASPIPVGPQGLQLVSVIDGGEQVAAKLSFSWRAPGSEEEIPSGALELWTFDADGLVTGIDAYYWDTAACAELVKRAAAVAASA